MRAGPSSHFLINPCQCLEEVVDTTIVRYRRDHRVDRALIEHCSKLNALRTGHLGTIGELH